MLVISRKPGDKLILGDDIEICILEVSGEKVKIGINAPKNVRIARSELLETQNANIEAQQSAQSDLVDLLKNRLPKK